MFIYHFSRLIKSKLLWAFLALLMVFAFVVMDSCSGPTGDYSAGYLRDEPVDYTTVEDASQVVTILQSNSRWYLPRQGQIFANAVVGGSAENHSRNTWKVIAARALAEEAGLTTDMQGATQTLERMFVDGNGVFNVNHYRFFLAQSNYREPHLFEKTFNNVWLPAQTVTAALFNSVGWASPMERDFAVSANYDKTTVYAASLKNTIDAATLAVTEADEAAWYAAHQEDYKLPEQRLISYVEVKADAFADKIVVEELDAMQYYDDNSDEFKGTGTNATKTLPFEEVKEKAIAKVKAQRALDEALTFANETLVARALTASFAEVAKAHGEVKQATLRQDTPAAGLQKARDVVAAAFEMDVADTPVNAVAGTDCVYLIRLEKVIPAHVAPLADVKSRVQESVRRDMLDKRLKTNGETIRALLAAELAKGTAFDQAVAACKVEGLTATTATTFVVSDAAAAEIPYRAEIMPVVSTLGTKALSEPLLTADKELVLVYVADRQPGDELVKANAKLTISDELTRGTSYQVAADWLEWNLARNPPVTVNGLPVLQDDVAEDEE